MLSSKNSSAKWKRFSGASYASFQSLHREVRIGVLSVAMLASVGLKANAAHLASLNDASQPMQRDLADSDSLVVGLEDVEILASRVPLTQMQAPRLVTVLSAVDIAAAAVHSVNDLLEYAVGVDVRQRGEFGVQTDISVRGGNFDQITILLNGINISSPHTGHLSADFPVSMQDIERIEVLEGPAARVFGTSAFTGVINVVTKSLPQPSQGKERNVLSGQGSLYGGSYGYAGADLSLGHSKGAFTNRLSGGYSRSDGATINSAYESTRAFYQGHYEGDKVRLDAQAGYSYKPYEANTFYGAKNNKQWESNERYMSALRAESQLGAVHLNGSLYWNRWFDHYQWLRGNPAGENFHKVDTWGGNANAWFESRLGKTSVGIEARHEGIFSTKLGEPLDRADFVKIQGHDAVDSLSYTKHDCRTNVSAFIEHDILLDQWTFSLGLLGNMNTGMDTRWRFYPGVDISFRPSNSWKLFASWNMALRMPTYTDLYYSGNNIEGNRNLKPEKTNDVSLGLRFRQTGWKAEASVFYSHKSDMIDWVTYNDATPTTSTGIYHSVNFTSDNKGIELSGSFLPREIWTSSPLRKIGFQYAYIDETSSYDFEVIDSKYAMDYLRHKVVLQADSKLWRNLNLSLAWRFQDRVGISNKPYALFDGRLSWDTASWSAYLDCSNLFDKQYYDYKDIPQPGRWAKVGVSYKF